MYARSILRGDQFAVTIGPSVSVSRVRSRVHNASRRVGVKIKTSYSKPFLHVYPQLGRHEGEHKHEVKDSSSVKEIRYNRERRILYVTFHDGSTYLYERVPLQTYVEIVTAGSVGRKLYDLVIKETHYEYRKVDV